MKTRAKSLLIGSASAFAIALLAFSMVVGGSHAVRADDPAIVSYPGQETVLVPVKDLQVLEQRVIYLEETVAGLTESWQHINTHRLCVSGQAGAAETCISKAQLDALLASQAEVAASDAPAAAVEEVKSGKEPVAVAATEDKSEPAPSPDASKISEQDPGTEPVAVAATGDKSEPTPSPDAKKVSEQDPGTEPVAVAATEDRSEPASSEAAVQVPQKDMESEVLTGSVATTEHAAEVSPAPRIEPLTEGDLP